MAPEKFEKELNKIGASEPTKHPREFRAFSLAPVQAFLRNCEAVIRGKRLSFSLTMLSQANPMNRAP
jgi:hypothetical protein